MQKKPHTLFVERRHPFRLWMTGSVAVLMAAIMPIRDASQTERQHLMRLLRHTHLGVNETILRLEASARDQGLSVLAMVRGERSVMVLGSSVGGTPIVMEEADSVPSMPLSLMVREGMSGGADVLASAAQSWLELPAEVASELAALPQFVDRALT